jgi:dTDP-L-rhamnose 4-epimerase
MAKTILITGGAGFIGSHLADELLAAGHGVRVLDNLSAQVHRTSAALRHLSPHVELIRGDVRDREAVRVALQGVDQVAHLAAAVGAGQSMCQVEAYLDTNSRGMAVLLEALIERPVERLLVASCMSTYGEGLYLDVDGAPVAPRERSLEQLQRGDWEVRDEAGRPLSPLPTPESKPALPVSVYALTKRDQEQLCLMIGRTHGFSVVVLRFFSVYGPRQELSGTCGGVLAIFAARYLKRKPPMIFEDGRQQRDFVSVHDVTRACRLALEVPGAAGRIFNVGSGRASSVLQVADLLSRILGHTEVRPQVTGEHRAGDVRHCFADISQARRVLGYQPSVELEEGLLELASWLEVEHEGTR